MRWSPIKGSLSLLVACLLSVSLLWADDGALGPQLFLKHGEKAIVLQPSQEAKDILPRQHLWMEGENGWLTYKGWLSSTFDSAGEIFLVYRTTVYGLGDKLELKLVRKAHKDQFFLATSGSAPDAPMLIRRANGEFASLSPSGNLRSFPFLSPYRDRVVVPWSSARFPFLYFPRQKGQDDPVLCAFDPGFEQGRPFDQPLIGFSLKAIAEGKEGVFLLGKEGVFIYNGSQLSKTSLPGGLMEKDLVAFCQEGEGWSGLYQNGEVSLKWVRTGGKTQDLPPHGATGVVKVQEGRAAHLQSVMMFGVMMVALFMVLRWRQESEASLPGKVELAPASIWLRSFAFVMDLVILSIPLSSLGHLLGIEALPLNEMANLPAMSSDQMTEFWMKMEEIMRFLAVILVILFFIYHVALEQWLGGSFGKLFFRLKVVDLDGNPPTIKASLIKALWRTLDVIIFPLISFISALTNEKRRSLGDRFSGLQVVQSKRG